LNLNQQIDDTAFGSYNRRSDKTIKRAGTGFNVLGIAPNLMKGVNRLNFANPTPIQKEAIPTGIQGDDIIAIAQTGSGKTLAYGIPMIQRLAKSKEAAALILVPTRELALQVEESLQAICRPLYIRTVVLIGGASISLQRIVLKKNPGIIIATPGRLMDHIERRTVNLTNIGVFVLDEADRMLDMGFLPDIKKIMKSIPEKRQTMLFSATMPKEIEAIAEKLMVNPTRIEIDRSGATPSEVSHEMFIIKKQDKSRLLAVQLKQCSGPVLVFTRTKWMARKLTEKVNNMGFASAEIHSNRSLGQRRHALEGFKRGRYQILVATDIAARGIDVSGIELVVNYDMPANSEDYVHRIGRTGRAGKTGHAISFATSAQERSIRDIERFMKTKLAVSALPTLPSEKLLLKDAARLNAGRDLSRDEEPPKRKPSKDRLTKRREFKKGDSKKFARKRVESKKKNFKSKDEKRQESKRKSSKPKNEHSTAAQSDQAFKAYFKKNRSGKKKSVGQGTRWKKRAKRK